METESDPTRILIGNAIGSVQAWPAGPDDVSVGLSWFGKIEHSPSKAAYVSETINLSAADARSVAASLIAAADHADAHAIKSEQVEAP